MKLRPWIGVSATRVTLNGRVFSVIVQRKCPELAPYIIHGKRVLANSASEKSLLDRFRVGWGSVESMNSIIEGHTEKDWHGSRPRLAPIK